MTQEAALAGLAIAFGLSVPILFLAYLFHG